VSLRSAPEQGKLLPERQVLEREVGVGSECRAQGTQHSEYEYHGSPWLAHGLLVVQPRDRVLANDNMFVWPTFTQTVSDVCEGLDEAWCFFGGITKRLVLDNASSMVTVPSAQAPVLQRSFQEYAHARGILVDPTRVRRPQDKAQVENAVPYVRERWCDGEHFLDVFDARRSAARWCDEVAGARVHGSTRAVPRDVFAAEEKMHLAPPPQSRFDVPVWSEAKVHPDHHVQIARALYSVPTAYIGRRLDVRLDSVTVRFYSGAELVKVHRARAPSRSRSTTCRGSSAC
jgi:hypothetical protein